jgi:ADP-ribose pyrophosphatase YjhB (NUDIX family)
LQNLPSAVTKKGIRPVRNSAKAVIVRDGCLLAIRHTDGEGIWHSLPGGGQEPGETLTEACRRECWEEVCADVSVGSLLFIREYIGAHHEFARFDTDRHYVEFLFWCEIPPDAEPALGSHPDTRQIGVSWLPLSNLEEFRLYPRVLHTLLKNGVPLGEPVYLGDIN